MKRNSYFEDILESRIADALPNEFYFSNHEMFHENIVHARTGRQQIR